MGWKTGHTRLTLEETKARLLALAEERSSPSILVRHPWRALAIALAVGFLFARTTRLWGCAGSGGMWLIQQILPLPLKPRNTALDRLKARTRRVG